MYKVPYVLHESVKQNILTICITTQCTKHFYKVSIDKWKTLITCTAELGTGHLYNVSSKSHQACWGEGEEGRRCADELCDRDIQMDRQAWTKLIPFSFTLRLTKTWGKWKISTVQLVKPLIHLSINTILCKNIQNNIYKTNNKK